MTTPDHAARFAAALARLRGAAGLSRYQLALRAGVQETALARMERGEWSPRLEALCRLADALGATLDDLCGRDERGTAE